MITITLTTEQLATIERALQRTTYDLKENYHANAVRDDELRLVQEALDALHDEGDEGNEAFEDYKYRRAQAEAWAKAERGE